MSGLKPTRSLFEATTDSEPSDAVEPVFRLIGVDEAGYGPNLGPLVIAATEWDVPRPCSAEGLYEVLADAVARTPREARDGRLLIADSKVVHQPSAGVARLETVAGTLLRVAGIPIVSFHQLLHELAAWSVDPLEDVPWYREDCPLPFEAAPDAIEASADRLSETLSRTGVALRTVVGDVVPAAVFNRELERCGTKGRLLSERTLDVVRRAVSRCRGHRVECVCDKHGGRNRYGALIGASFRTASVACERETAEVSEYVLGRTRFRFCCRAERFLPVAAASVVAKYLREIAMHLFNRYWQRAVRGLKPTKGYPADARRFRDAIAQAARHAGIDDHVLWRRR